MQNIEVEKYRTQNIEVAKYQEQNIEHRKMKGLTSKAKIKISMHQNAKNFVL